MEHNFPILLAVIVLALIYGFTNGLHDSAAQVATAISSRALSPETALILSSLSNFLGACLLGTTVAKTVGNGLVSMELIPNSRTALLILLSALGATNLWNIMAWWFGIPSSSTHALMGSLGGAFLSGVGNQAIRWSTLNRVLILMFLAPILVFVLTYFFTRVTFFVTQLASPRANRLFRGFQTFSLIAQSLTHGSNDSQKVMGTMVLALTAAYGTSVQRGEWVPSWVIVSSAGAMAVGVLIGGWRVIQRVGYGLYAVRPIHSFASQISSAAILFSASSLGAPLSTTHVITSSVLGAGAAFRPNAVRWRVAGEFVLLWLVTIPASALIAALLVQIFHYLRF